jgi:hypothetical protein
VPPLIVGLLINGVAYAAIAVAATFVIERLFGARYARLFTGLGLIVAALFYVYFAARADESGLWNAAELVGVAVFGAMAVFGMRGSRWWLVAGWALHPFWDVVLHYFLPGRAFAPIGYVFACLSFDLLIAAYIALVGRRWEPRLRSALAQGD